MIWVGYKINFLKGQSRKDRKEKKKKNQRTCQNNYTQSYIPKGRNGPDTAHRRITPSRWVGPPYGGKPAAE